MRDTQKEILYKRDIAFQLKHRQGTWQLLCSLNGNRSNGAPEGGVEAKNEGESCSYKYS